MIARPCGARLSASSLGSQTGLEPRKLFNVVEFMMHDEDSSGTIDMDECMEILFRRFGKEQLEERTNGALAPLKLVPRGGVRQARRHAPRHGCAARGMHCSRT